jgi:hypothetical protein
LRLVLAALLAMGCDPDVSVDTSGAIVCDARGILVNGKSIELYTGGLGERSIDNCIGARFANLLDPQMWSLYQSREFALTIKSNPGLQLTSPGDGGAKIRFGEISCTAYGAVLLENIKDGWRAKVDMQCPDGATVVGEFVGIGF